MLVSATFMASRINTGLSFVFLVAIPILATALFAIMFMSFPRFRQMFVCYDKMNGAIQENLIGIRVVKAFVRDKFENKKLVSHLTAQTLQYDTLAERPFSWTLRNYQVRTMVDGREVIKKGSVIDSVILMEPKDFFYVKGQQETFTLPELDEFIEKQKMRGAAGISTFEVEYHKRFASPFAAFILTLIGASLSAEKRKGGMGFSIAIGIALSFAYIMFQTIFATFAINAGWSAMISVWIPNIIFAGIAFWLYKRAPQ